jgi:folate-binding protein YgfZ
LISPWKEFLSGCGANFDDGVVKDFGDPLAEERALSSAGVICDLSHRGLIAVTGDEAFTFLQGQLTCDLAEVNPTRSRLAAWCTPKGRVLVLFRVFHLDSGFLLELPGSLTEATLRRLRLYVLRAQVSLEDVSEDSVRLGLAGDSARVLIESRYGSAPRFPDAVATSGGVRLIRLHGAVPRYQFIGDTDGAEVLWRAATQSLAPVGQALWSRLEISAGVPEIMQGDQYLPQMINLDALGGLSFKKGCYVGQEIIARSRYLGRLKRRMYLIGAGVGDPPPPGAAVVDATAGPPAGEVVSSGGRGQAGGFSALAVLRIDAAKSGVLHLGSTDGPRLELLDLPYPVGDEYE